MRRISFKKEIEEGEVLPFGYAIAYFSYEYNRRVCYPVGIHLVVGLLRKIYFGFAKTRIRDAEGKGYRDGYNRGREIGKQEAFKHWDYLMKTQAEYLGKKFDGLVDGVVSGKGK